MDSSDSARPDSSNGSAQLTRREALQCIGFGAAFVSVAGLPALAADPAEKPALHGRVNHSVCRWCYGKIALDDLCAAAKQMGLKSVELVQPADFPILQKHGLMCAMVMNPSAHVGDVEVGGIPRAWNRPEYHDALVTAYESHLHATAEAGYPNLICFSGNRDGMSDAEGLEHCVAGLKRIVPLAEKLGVTLCMELLNSKVNHPDYMCDHTAWGVKLCERIGSERFRLLYDIYHMQIMEGDVIATIQANHRWIAHYHTGGVPGRAEIDETQELNYPAIMRAILDTGFRGYVAQEFVPKHPDAIASLRQGVQICDV